jgi:hypothetical protein
LLVFVNESLYGDVTDERKHAAKARRVEIFVLLPDAAAG